jgi:hypothetical protein
MYTAYIYVGLHNIHAQSSFIFKKWNFTYNLYKCINFGVVSKNELILAMVEVW